MKKQKTLRTLKDIELLEPVMGIRYYTPYENHYYIISEGYMSKYRLELKGSIISMEWSKNTFPAIVKCLKKNLIQDIGEE